MAKSSNKTAIVIPNWNGADLLRECLDSLLVQSQKISIIVVDNGSVDDSLTILESYGSKITTLEEPKNLGFAGGVNVGIQYALDANFDYIGLLNNDAAADRNWAKELISVLDSNPEVGITTSKILIGDTGKLDSTGDWYTTTGMPFPRGRDELDKGQYDKLVNVFGASGGASLYRADLLRDVGLFDEDFFAYYEDVDISFRAQLFGWKVTYNPKALVYHKLSATSSKHGYFAIRQSAKNFWYLYVKNLPIKLFWKYLPAASYRYARMFAARLIKGGFWAFFNGWAHAMLKLPKKLFVDRRFVQKNKRVSNAYLESIIYKGKPPVKKTTSSK